MAVETTVTLTDELIKYIDKLYLERSVALNIHTEGAKEKTLSKNSGKTVTWNRRSPKAVATTALTEGVTPTESQITTNKVTATLAGYGNWEKISSLLYNTGLDAEAKESIEVMGQNASETIDTLVRNELHAGGTVQFAAGRANLAAMTADDVLTLAEIRKAVRALKKKNALTYGDGFFLGKIGPDTSYNLMADTAWLDAQKYTARKELYRGEVGSIHKVRFLEASSNQMSEKGGASNLVDVYSNFIHGKEAFGTVDLSGQGRKKLIIKRSDSGDTSNPLNQFHTIGWKAEAFATKTLNPDWIVNIKTGAKD